ncbi:MAG: hypothetical protein HYY13_08700 [Nitrospirae bacterium]|nr:hypothetical protein [Nitrospirota bacterium]
MSPSEIKTIYPKYKVVQEEKNQDFGRERHRLVMESDRIRREFIFERRGSQLVVHSMTVTWTAWDEARFLTIRTGLAGKWGAPHDSKDVFGVAYDKWEFEDSTTGLKVHATLLAPRQPLLGYARADDPGAQPAAPNVAGSGDQTQAGVPAGSVVAQKKEATPQFGDPLPPSLSILLSERRVKPKGSDRNNAGAAKLVPVSSGSGGR